MTSKKVIELEGPFCFVHYLYYNDDSGLSAEDLEICHEWLRANGVTASGFVDVGDFVFPMYFEGTLYDCATYTFLKR